MKYANTASSNVCTSSSGLRRVARSESAPARASLPGLGIRKQGAEDLPVYWEMSRPSEQYAQFCADAHQKAEHSPLEFRTLESYRALDRGRSTINFSFSWKRGYTMCAVARRRTAVPRQPGNAKRRFAVIHRSSCYISGSSGLSRDRNTLLRKASDFRPAGVEIGCISCRP